MPPTSRESTSSASTGSKALAVGVAPVAVAVALRASEDGFGSRARRGAFCELLPGRPFSPCGVFRHLSTKVANKESSVLPGRLAYRAILDVCGDAQEQSFCAGRFITSDGRSRKRNRLSQKIRSAEPFGFQLSRVPDRVHYCAGIDAIAWPFEQVTNKSRPRGSGKKRNAQRRRRKDRKGSGENWSFTATQTLISSNQGIHGHSRKNFV